MSKILVVYFSRTGTTENVATAIARELDCDIEHIAEDRSRAGVLGWLRSGYEATFGKNGPIHAPTHDPSAYNLVVLGTPIWNQSPSSPVISYVRMHRKALSSVAFFCTCDGRGEEAVFAKLAQETGLDPLAVLGLKRAQIESGAAKPKIVSFAHLLSSASSPASESGLRRMSPRPFRLDSLPPRIAKGA